MGQDAVQEQRVLIALGALSRRQEALEEPAELETVAADPDEEDPDDELEEPELEPESGLEDELEEPFELAGTPEPPERESVR